MVADPFALVHRVVDLTVTICTLLRSSVTLLRVVPVVPVMDWGIGLDRVLLMFTIVTWGCDKKGAKSASSLPLREHLFTHPLIDHSVRALHSAVDSDYYLEQRRPDRGKGPSHRREF